MNSNEANLLMKALVCHLLNTGGACIITFKEIEEDKVLTASEEDDKLVITVTRKSVTTKH